jgi:hypothetical protein
MSQPMRGSQPPAAAAALPIIQRLIATVDAENRDLEQGRRVKYEVYSLNKNQGLLELNRLLPALAVAAAAGSLRDALAELHAKLEINRRALAVQLKACEAVSDLAWSRSRE